MSVDVTALRDSVLRYANDGAGQALELMRQSTRDHAPYGASEAGRDGPHLVDTEEAIVLEEGETWRGTLAYTADHASWLDEGTGPHEITGNPFLAFQWEGQTIIVRSVHHPGSTLHVGWFSNNVTDGDWVAALTDGLDSVQAD